MSRSIGNIVADSLQLSLNYSERLLTGVTAENFCRLASPGGHQVESNHPAFIYGHLSLYAPQILTQLDRSDLAASLPADFGEKFSKDAKCVDDPDGSIYPAMNLVTEAFFTGYRNVLATLREVSDNTVQRPNPLEGRLSELFPTLGSLHGFYVGGHMMIHLGQLSAWRRMMGLGPA